jgi:hypothetical protein
MNVAERALDAEAVGTHGCKVRPACNEVNVRARLLQPSAEKAADTAGAYDGNPHWLAVGGW